MDLIPLAAEIKPFIEEISALLTMISTLVGLLFARDRRRKNQLRDVMNSAHIANNVLLELAKRKKCGGAVKEIEKLLKP